MIEVINLHKSFSMGGEVLHVLKGLNLKIADREFISIVGASGVGKSTFLQILGTIDRPTSGNVYFDNVDIFSFNENQIASMRNEKVGFIFQFHHLLPEFTAMENVAMPVLIKGKRRKEALEMARELLEDVGLKDRLKHKPGELSGGEQQRVAVARSLILSPQILLADEPTGNLDTNTSLEVFHLLREMNKKKGMITVLVTHNERLASQCDRIIHMVDGVIES